MWPRRSDPVFVAAVRAGILVVALAGPSLALAQAPSPRRAVPDYDARAPRAVDGDDVLLGIARVLASPLWFVSEYLVRRPIGTLGRFLEREHVLQDLSELFSFGPNDSIRILPTMFADFGFVPSVGLLGRWRDFLGAGHRLDVQLTTGGADWVNARAALRIAVGCDVALFVRGGYLRRPDLLLGGASLDPPSQRNARYSLERGDAEIGYELRPRGGRSNVGASFLVLTESFGDTSIGPERSVVSLVRETGQSLPVGFAGGYVVGMVRAHGVVDTRWPPTMPAAGVRVAAYADLAVALQGLASARWIRLGGDGLVATDVLGARRVISLELDASAIVPIGQSVTPFDQAIDLGGLGPMPGFWPGQLRGTSAIALTLAYEWPVWVLLHAQLHVALGGAFGREYHDLAMDRMRLSFGVALHPMDLGEQPFEAGLALGTEPVGDGATVSSVRIFLGTRSDL